MLEDLTRLPLSQVATSHAHSPVTALHPRSKLCVFSQGLICGYLQNVPASAVFPPRVKSLEASIAFRCLSWPNNFTFRVLSSPLTITLALCSSSTFGDPAKHQDLQLPSSSTLHNVKPAGNPSISSHRSLIPSHYRLCLNGARLYQSP